MYPARRVLEYAVITSFLLFNILMFGVPRFVFRSWKGKVESEPKIPDFSRYESVYTVPEGEFPLDDPTKRVIVVGDIHGMIEPLHMLLDRLSYDSRSDVLVHTGDIVSRGPHKGSMAALAFMVANNVTGVRGNHEQKIVEWRGWIDWIQTLPQGRQWLERIERRWNESNLDVSRAKFWVEAQKRAASKEDRRWWKLVPPKWIMFSDHYKIAREMESEDFNYLLHLPLKLYVPSAHLFVVHAGLLPSDPRYPYYDASRQPLARMPTRLGDIDVVDGDEEEVSDAVRDLRKVQEMALMTEIPQNLNPWTSLNMRSVQGGKVVKSNKGDPWSNLWNKEMGHCVGFNNEHSNTSSRKKHPLPCYPLSVVYGHSAARGLDVKRWTVGLDSGCIYGRKMSALVIGGRKKKKLRRPDELGEEEEEEEDLDVGSIADTKGKDVDDAEKSKEIVIPFGDNGTARIFSVKCQKPR